MHVAIRVIALLVVPFILLLLPGSSSAGNRVIGALLTSDLARYREAHHQLLKVLTARGLMASNEIIVQTPNPDPQSWGNSIRKLVAYGADIIIAYGAPAVAVALKEGDGVPVVAADAVLPEGAPGANLCGISARVPMVTLLRVLEGIKHLQHVGVLYNSHEVGSLRQMEELRRAARQMNINLVEVNATTPAAVEPAVSALMARVDGMVVTESSVICRHFDRIAARSHRAGVLLATTLPGGADKGALVSLEVSPAEQGEVAGLMAVRLLEGAHPAQLGIASPRRIELVLNLKVAREIEATIPFQVLSMATRIYR